MHRVPTPASAAVLCVLLCALAAGCRNTSRATPKGLSTIREKHVSDTMSSIGADADDDRYAIEDVPWTQDFEGSLALHTAFWHERFGPKRKHGCVNLAPLDAHYIFSETWPVEPGGGHGVTTNHTGLHGSHVLITR